MNTNTNNNRNFTLKGTDHNDGSYATNGAAYRKLPNGFWEKPNIYDFIEWFVYNKKGTISIQSKLKDVKNINLELVPENHREIIKSLGRNWIYTGEGGSNVY